MSQFQSLSRRKKPASLSVVDGPDYHQLGDAHGSPSELLQNRFSLLYCGGVDTWKVEYEGPAHMKNWLECCKSRKQPNSTIELGHRVITTAHLAN